MKVFDIPLTIAQSNNARFISHDNSTKIFGQKKRRLEKLLNISAGKGGGGGAFKARDAFLNL